MKRADAARAAILVKALSGLRAMNAACKMKEPDRGYDRLGLEISVASISDSGGTTRADIELDLATAQLLMPMIRRLILAELHEMGVKP